MPAKRNPKNTQFDEIISETPISNNIVPVISVVTPVKRTPVSTRSTPTTKATGGRRKPRKTDVSVQPSVISNEIIDDEIIDGEIIDNVIPETSTATTVMTGKTRSTVDTSITDKYQKLNDIDHVLIRPDMYAGNTTLDESELYVYENEMMTRRSTQYVPALFKIFDEGLVNMRDHVERMRISQIKQDHLRAGIQIDDRTITVKDVYRPVKQIAVEIDPAQNRITMTNDGNGIDIVLHPEHGIYVPELIFFHPKSGTNYDDNVKRTWGGKNGIGSKLIAIFSTQCTIETVDHVRKLKYVQTCRNNMRDIDPPVITSCRTLPYTRISFHPDLRIFGLTSFDNYDFMPLFYKRVYDIAACTNKNVNVLLNGAKVPVRDFEKYVDLYIGSKKEAKRIKLQPNDCWEVYVGLNTTGKFEQVSFVNGVCTSHGGKHVDHVATKVVNKLVEEISTKKQCKDVKPQMVKNLLTIFINATIVNPGFDSQMKSCLTTASKDFGSEFTVGPEEVKSLLKLGLVEACVQALTEKNKKTLEKMGGRKARIKDEKSVVAKYAGTTKSKDCILILTEGDSAKTLAMSGLDALDEEDRNYIGVMPLKGKVINVKTSTTDKIISNDEYKRIINMMGLKPGLRDYSKLNYGHIAILTDADHDGYHIKGLLFNMFHKFWPELLKSPKFFLSIRTPIVGLTHKRTKAKQYLYSYVEFSEWQAAHQSQLKDYEFVYYKGLGTHTPVEAREIFANLQYIDYVWQNDLRYKWLDLATVSSTPGDELIIEQNAGASAMEIEIESPPIQVGYPIVPQVSIPMSDNGTPHTNDSESSNSFKKLKPVEEIFQKPGNNGQPDYCDASLRLAFDDQMEDHRKDWILKYLVKRTEGNVDYNFQKGNSINYFDFINSELIEFSVEDNNRSIPNIMDGFKPSQRKIVYSCLRRRTPFKKIRVDQLAGNISENANYHHGNESLNGAIVLLAQDYVGSNNINLLVPEGQFGSRIGGGPKKQIGADHAAPRYLFTNLSPIASHIFDKRDLPLLEWIYDEGRYWEPHYYLPTLPLILVNGARGIGTGFATDVSSYNPIDIMNNMRRYLANEPLAKMTPYYHGFKGTIVQESSHKYRVTGCYERDDLNETVTVTELPVGTKSSLSFVKYQNELESLLEKMPETIKDVECQYTDVNIKAVITFQPSYLAKYDQEKLEKLLKLSSNISTANMNLYTPERILKHYDSSEEILTDFMQHRVHCYERRRVHMLNKLREECDIIQEKIRFIGYEIDDINSFTIRKKKQGQAVELLRQNNFKTTDEIKSKYKTDNIIDIENDEEQNQEQSQDSGDIVGYAYLVKMPMINQTQEMITKLNNDHQKKLAEITELEGKTAEGLYSEDLEMISQSYNKFTEEWSKKAYASLTKSGSSKSGKQRGRSRTKPKALMV